MHGYVLHFCHTSTHTHTHVHTSLQHACTEARAWCSWSSLLRVFQYCVSCGCTHASRNCSSLPCASAASCAPARRAMGAEPTLKLQADLHVQAHTYTHRGEARPARLNLTIEVHAHVHTSAHTHTSSSPHVQAHSHSHLSLVPSKPMAPWGIPAT